MINITSNNQSGGITAHTVNQVHALPPRQLDKIEAMVMVREIPKDHIVTVAPEHGDAESYNYAQQIVAFLQEHGYSCDLGTMMASEPAKHVSWHIGPNQTLVRVGPR